MTEKDFVKKYHGKEIEDAGANKGREFVLFAKDFRSTVKEIATKKLGAQLSAFHTGHYDVSGFIEKDEKFVYFSYSEPRGRALDLFRTDAHEGILLRTAENTSDFKGGHNHFTNIMNFASVAGRLLERRCA